MDEYERTRPGSGTPPARVAGAGGSAPRYGADAADDRPGDLAALEARRDPRRPMGRADFLEAETASILTESVAFAAGCGPAGAAMDLEALRDHAAAMLADIAADLIRFNEPVDQALDGLAALPGMHLLLAPDAPRFTVLAASDERLAATLTTRAAALGHPLVGAAPSASGGGARIGDTDRVAEALCASPEAVLRTRAPDRMAVQRRDTPGADGAPAARYPDAGPEAENTCFDLRVEPVRDADGRVAGVLHAALNVTEQIGARGAVDRSLAESDRLRVNADERRA